MKVLMLQILAGLVVWLLAGLGVAMLFKTRILAFELSEEAPADIVPAVVAPALAPARR
jgi:hypothetical protein